MAYKVFQNGFPLNASELNNYLMNQSVMVFATATARDTDLTAPLEGMIVWLQDSNKFVYYTGTAWADVTGNGANAIINGAFDFWQRGTSFTDGYTADRWRINANGSGVTKAITQQTFTPGTAPVAGYEGQYYLRWNQSVAGTGATLAFLQTGIEDVRTFAGQTVTVSFWAKSDVARNITTGFWRNYGSGGSGVDYGISENTYAITTSWARYSFTTSLSSLTGKTIGAGSYLLMYFSLPINTAHTTEIWGVQLEAGSVATPFKRNQATVGLEEIACMAYYEKSYDRTTNPGTANGNGAVGNPVMAPNGTSGYRSIYIPFKVRKRGTPTITLYDINGTSGKATTYSSVDLSQTAGVNNTSDSVGNSGFRTYLVTGNGGYAFHYVADSEF